MAVECETWLRGDRVLRVCAVDEYYLKKLDGARSISNAFWAPWISSISVSMRKSRARCQQPFITAHTETWSGTSGEALSPVLPEFTKNPLVAESSQTKALTQSLQLIHIKIVNREEILTSNTL